MDENMLIQTILLAKEGNNDAIATLFHEFKDLVYTTAIRVLKNPEIAEDIVQETFITVILKIRGLENPMSFRRWITTITYSKCSDFLKKKEVIHEQVAEITDAGTSVFDFAPETNLDFLPDKALDQTEFRATIVSMIEKLPGVQRAALLMFYFDDMTIKDIATIQEVSINTANTRLNRARKSLKKTIEDYEKKHDVRLHSISFFALFMYLYDNYIQTLPIDAAHRIQLSFDSVVQMSTSIVAGSVETMITAGKMVAKNISQKIIVGITLTAITFGGVALAFGMRNQHSEHISAAEDSYAATEWTNDVSVDEIPYETLDELVDKEQDIYAAYKAFLSTGRTANELVIRYYAYCDLDLNGVPELVVADNNGTPEKNTQGEIYTYKDDCVCFIDFTGSYYDYLYHVNDKYIRGTGKAGVCYVSIDEYIDTTVALVDESGEVNGPAVSSAYGIWEYITEEEFDYYNRMSNGFVQKSEIISLIENPYLEYEWIDTKYFSIQLPIFWRDKYAYRISGNNPTDFSVCLYEIEHFNNGWDGELACISLWHNKDYEDFPDYEVKDHCNIEGSSYDIVVLYPTDIRCNMEPENEKYMNLYLELSNSLYEDICSEDQAADNLKVFVKKEYIVDWTGKKYEQ